MKPSFGISLNPSDYAWELVKRLGFKEPSFEWVDIVLEHLGLKRQFYSGSPFFTEPGDCEITRRLEGQMRLFDIESKRPATPRRQQQRPIDGVLFGRAIFVDTDFPLERQHLATCHEVGHFYLPWHKDLTYFKDGCIVEPPGTEQYELDANRFAADLLMPRPFFTEDMDSLPFGLQSVERLSGKYLTSLESTARHYVDLSLRSCALVIVEALADGAITLRGSRHKVRYHKGSHSFNHFIHPGTEIVWDSPIAQASLIGPGLVLIDEVPGWVLGLRPERRLILHCRPWGKEGDVLVLVEERQGNQGRFF